MDFIIKTELIIKRKMLTFKITYINENKMREKQNNMKMNNKRSSE